MAKRVHRHGQKEDEEFEKWIASTGKLIDEGDKDVHWNGAELEEAKEEVPDDS